MEAPISKLCPVCGVGFSPDLASCPVCRAGPIRDGSATRPPLAPLERPVSELSWLRTAPPTWAGELRMALAAADIPSRAEVSESAVEIYIEASDLYRAKEIDREIYARQVPAADLSVPESSDGSVCPACSAEIGPLVEECPDCGLVFGPAVPDWTCVSCSAAVQEGEQSCSCCGAEIDWLGVTEPPAD